MVYRLISVGVAALTLGLSGGAQAQAPDLSGLHDALHLTAAQEDAWRGYRAAITPDPAADQRHRSAQLLMTTLTTPRRVDLINAEMDADMAAVHRQGEAVKAFYAALTPDQQRTFDHQTLSTGQSGGRSGSGGAPLRQPQGSDLRQPGSQY